ncbi:hypothetical protein ABB37_02054 [Leptomonas pyrrhocoris]|uniref:Transmembrane protein n=1 Tax=Leptomonas pyrrhocoris TaxID=157538 RepID=A0A0M9G7D1_LEPPY|nr:hypothetical protein ABB37_02054 [Leptomonas pyrrhocoris]KPA83859.1 hypothetical protein ABB37_02054 [Leptomonas pyrrhocoris]|eukprot:XP_015662298.1 hypothetical protein ABB37_02054 [Leptomonas pyrrhocoris]
MVLKAFVLQHRYVIIDYAVLVMVVAVCVPFLALVPGSRPYGATVIGWTLAFTFHLWRRLPWERAHVRRTAHRRADRCMRERGVGNVHRRTESSDTTALWILSAMVHREDGGNCLPGDKYGRGGEEDSSFEWGPGRWTPQKLLQDTTRDSISPLRCPTPWKEREEAAAAAAEGEGGNAHLMISQGSTSLRGASPLPRISASALESSSQFLALSASASPTRSLPLPEPEKGELYVRRSHEPFTHVSRHPPSSMEDSAASVSSPTLSAIAADEFVLSAAVPFPSLSPASSCQTHGYVPPSLGVSRSTSPLLLDHEADTPASVSMASTVRSPSRISILSSNVRRQGALTHVPRGSLREG